MNKLFSTMMVLVLVCIFSLVIGLNYNNAKGAPKSNNNIGGAVHVSGKGGNAAGVWVIAETDEVETNNGSPGIYRKIVVTDDKGNFLIPDLPPATYNVWVRGYGLADSTPVPVTPGNNVQLHADLASSPQEAAQVYPASFWLSLYQPPPKYAFPGGGGPTGISTSMHSQYQWINTMKLGCELCHQVGDAETRDLLTVSDWDEAWHLAGTMNAYPAAFGRIALANTLVDWTNRIDEGEVPPAPQRPTGIEMGVVITEWEWGDQFTYAHDEVSTDKRNPELYPNGMVYGVDLGNDYLNMTDPVNNISTRVHIPTVGGWNTAWCDQTFGFCTWNVYNNPANPHNPMMDDTGKVWITTQIRDDANLPSFCTSNPNGFPDATGGHRQAGFYDTTNDQFTLLDTCFGTHHLEFDNNGVVWFSGDTNVIGWIDPSKLDYTDETTLAATLPDAEGWSRTDVDDGTGTMVHIPGFHYGINVNPVDGSIWSSMPGYPGYLDRYSGETDGSGTHEVYKPPLDTNTNQYPHNGIRGVDVDTNGIVWVGLAGSGELASFNRSICVAHNHTKGTGDQCPEGWTIYDYSDSPQMKGENNPGTSDFHYLLWVDQHNASGLGENTVFLTGTGSDSLIAFNQTTHEFSIIRNPYPLVAYMRGLDGRIDDPDTGWKGRGLWVDYGNDPIKHTETGFGQVWHVQFRPSPLSQ